MPATGGNFPTILVVQEVFGVHEWIRDICRRLAKMGYYAIAPELYAREGDPTKISDTNQLMKEIVSKVPDQQVMSDLDAAVAFANRLETDDRLVQEIRRLISELIDDTALELGVPSRFIDKCDGRSQHGNQGLRLRER